MKIERVLAVAACGIVALGLVLAFLTIGPPSHARLIALDQQRVRDLDDIASTMHDRFAGTKSVPKRLPGDLPQRDPVTGLRYEFQRLNATTYRLCARFSSASENGNARYLGAANWPHGAGRSCYEFDLSSPEVAPLLVPAVRSRTE